MKVLMVCLGNICRSPLAHGILERMIEEQELDWEVDSCGTSGFHNGEQADQRSIEVAKLYGLDISHQKSRQLKAVDTEEFDLVIAMDASNYQDIVAVADSKNHHKIKMLLNYSFPGENRKVPDPYYEGGFDNVYRMIEQACRELIKQEL